MTDTSIFYDRTPALSHNAVVTMTIGMRGAGKTFAYKRWCILDTDHEFVWIRRYETELAKTMKTFLGDMIHERVIDPTDASKWVIRGHQLLYGDKDSGYVVRGHFIALSKQAIEKSGSFANVDKMVFDECFLKPHGSHHYLKDEVETFLELVETVNRLRIDGRKEVRAVLIGNKTSWLNPWFSYYHIKPFSQRFAWAPGKKGLVLVENYTNPEFTKVKKETRFGRLIDGTRYGAYAMENESWFDDGDSFIRKKSAKHQPYATVTYHGRTYGIWSDGATAYIGEPFRTYVALAGSVDDMTEELQLSYPTLNRLTNLYESGTLFFKDANVKFEIIDMLQRYAGLKR